MNGERNIYIYTHGIIWCVAPRAHISCIYEFQPLNKVELLTKIRGAPPRTPPGLCPGPRRGFAPDPAGALPWTPPGLCPGPRRSPPGASWGSAPDPSQEIRMLIY